MEVIGIIVLVIIGIVVLGIGGWILEGISWIIGVLFNGIGHLISNCFGCLFWIFIIFFGLVCLSMLV